MGNYNFRKDISREKKVNKVYINLIKNVENVSSFEEAPDKKFTDWDLIQKYPNKKQQTIELKEDLKAKETGNIYVEIETRGSFSGITISKADFFVYIVHNKNGDVEFLKIPTPTLKELMNNFGAKKEFGGDRGSNTKGYVISLTKLNEYKIFSMKETEFEKKVQQIK